MGAVRVHSAPLMAGWVGPQVRKPRRRSLPLPAGSILSPDASTVCLTYVGREKGQWQGATDLAHVLWVTPGEFAQRAARSLARSSSQRWAGGARTTRLRDWAHKLGVSREYFKEALTQVGPIASAPGTDKSRLSIFRTRRSGIGWPADAD